TVNKTTGKIDAVSTGTCKLSATSSMGVTKAIWIKVQDSLNTSNIKYIAHRGAMDLAPECTIPAFKMADSSGYQAFECDIWQTKYNDFIVFHETLAQKLGKNIEVKNLTKEKVKKYPIVYGKNIEQYSPLYIPSVAKTLSYAKTTDMEVYFHLKVNSSSLPFTKESAKKLSSIIKNSGMENRVVVFSSNKKALKLLKPYKLRMGYLNMAKTSTDMKTAAKYAKDNGCGTVYLKYYPDLMLPKSVVEYCHDLNLQVGSFSLNNTTEVENLINVGADFAVCNKVLFKK
ncbi:MAG: glycerophosphodiester phosphodiesterase, partial [Hominimerdicola sp.]